MVQGGMVSNVSKLEAATQPKRPIANFISELEAATNPK
jgi:hypothetical protein